MKVVAVIPARYGSSRSEGKPLADIGGAPMIEWVYRRVAAATKIAEVVVATDDPRIADVCVARGLAHVMTSSANRTSTERLAEVAQGIDADLYVCVNGDEPLIDPAHIDAIVPSALPAAHTPYVANLTTRIQSPAQVMDPSNIKVAFAADGSAQFMSRAPIPFPKGSLDFDYFKHVGVLAYNRAALAFFAATPRGRNEAIEDVNELRFIEHGVPLAMVVVEPGRGLSVDTPTDLEHVRAVVAREGLTVGG